MSAITSINPRDGQPGEAVMPPRATDAIGETLRHAFAAPIMPEEMARLLRAIDGRPTGH